MRTIVLIVSLTLVALEGGCNRKADQPASVTAATLDAKRAIVVSAPAAPSISTSSPSKPSSLPQPREVVDETLKPLQGVWRIVAGGKAGELECLKKVHVAWVDDGRLRTNVVVDIFGKEEVGNGSISVKPDADPKRIDIPLFGETRYASIYEMHDDILILAIPSEPEARPTRMPDGETVLENIGVLVLQKASTDPNDWVKARERITAWDARCRAAEDLEVAKALVRAKRPRYARAILNELSERFYRTVAGLKAAAWLKSPPKDSELAPDPFRRLQGVWRAVSVGEHGVTKLAEGLGIAWVDGKQVWCKWADVEVSKGELSFEPDDPMRINVPIIEKVNAGIYELHGDVLILALTQADRLKRLAEFPDGANKKEGVFVVVWQRMSGDPDLADRMREQIEGWRPEQRATHGLQAAKVLIQGHRPAYAKTILQGLVDRYGETPASREATELLKAMR